MYEFCRNVEAHKCEQIKGDCGKELKTPYKSLNLGDVYTTPSFKNWFSFLPFIYDNGILEAFIVVSHEDDTR